MNEYREIGRVVRLQIQRQTLKHPLEPRSGDRRSPERFYDPQHIMNAEELWVADSVAAIGLGDDQVLDVHSAAHPFSRNRGNGNMLSVGFSSHYDKMRARFGDHLVDGIAGENILVESAESFWLDDVVDGLAIRNADGHILMFDTVTVAAPCVEFSRFCLNDRYASPGPTSEALRFLDGGVRGFYAFVTSGLPAMIHVGDSLMARP